VADAPDTLARRFYGEIAARETVDLAFEVGGRLDQLIPEEGARVAKGTALAALEEDPFQRALERAELNLAQAEREARRVRALTERAVNPEARAEDAETARDLAEVAMRDAQAALADATLTAPFDALVASRLTPAQSIVSPGQPILRLHDMSEIRVEIDFPERLFVVAGGLEAITFTATAPDGTALPLRLVAFQPDTSRVGQSYRVTLAFTSDPGAAVLPGASVTVTAAVPSGATGVSVPATALVAQNDRTAAVLMVEGAGDAPTLRSVPVTVAAPTGTGFVVEGLPPGAEIVAAGAHRLTDGQTVRRFTDLRVTEN
jgi:RND family efflux transporter MFP subunit